VAQQLLNLTKSSLYATKEKNMAQRNPKKSKIERDNMSQNPGIGSKGTQAGVTGHEEDLDVTTREKSNIPEEQRDKGDDFNNKKAS
jgi:hypothetical protein